MSKHIIITNKKRFPILDKVRGLAVLLMFISHSIDFFYNGNSLSVDLARWFTATVAFTTFIYVSGASNYIANVDLAGESDLWQRKKLHILIKTFQFLLIYYLVAILLSLLDQKALNLDILKEILPNILIFKLIPTYTEFLIAFLILSLSLVLFGRVYKLIIKNSFVVILIGINAYILGMLLYQIDLGVDLNHYKSLFVGHEQGYQFPVFQYFPIYLFGMKFGSELMGGKSKFKISWILQLLFISLLTLFFAITKTWQPVVGEGYIFLQRWPPSVSFLIIGLVFVQLVIIVYKFFNLFINNKQHKTSVIEFIGKNPLDFYVLHILLLESYKTFIGTKTGNVILVFMGFCTLTFVVSVLVYTMKKITILPKLQLESRINGIISERFEIMIKYTYRVIALLLVLAIAFIVYSKVNVSEDTKISSVEEGVVKGYVAPEKDEDIIWWNKDYKYNSELMIKNIDSEHLLPKDSWVVLQVNHRELVEKQKSKLNADDLTVVYLLEGEYHEQEVFIEEINTPTTKIYFQLNENLAPEASVGNYYLYYGNKQMDSDTTELSKPLLKTLKFKVSQGEENSALIVTNLSRAWYLKDYDKVSPDDKNVLYKIQLTTNEVITDDIVSVIVTDSKDVENKYRPPKIDEKIYELQLPTEDLESGKYSIKTVVEGKNYESDTLTFNVSYPLFVTWTMDWEGYDVSEDNLRVMDELTSKYGMPMTTFFNPRIFAASEISPARITRMVEWIKLGQKKRGDEIALHLHMHQDMISKIGLEPKTEPRWGGRVNGHDVLTTAYEYDEFKQIIEWSLEQYAVNGLPEPVSYRAGGWFIDEDNLRVLADLNFKIDSSGREAIIYGPNKIENPWTLSSTTKPYKPSLSNQNISAEPFLNIWEYPNNGMDSTNRDFEILRDKFDDNYKSMPLEEPQVVTYLSHPHWFTKLDQSDMERIFDYIEPMKYENDNGPVIYSTLENTLSTIDKDD